MEKKKHKEPITTPFSAAWEDSTRGLLRGCFHVTTTSQLPNSDTQSCCCQQKQHTLTHSHKCQYYLYTSTHCSSPEYGPRSAQGKPAHRDLPVQKGAKNKQTSHTLRSGLACFQRPGQILQSDGSGKATRTENFLVLQFFFFFCRFGFPGACRRKTRAPEQGRDFFRQAAGSEDPCFRGLRFCSRRTDQRLGGGFADAGESL